MSNLEIFGWLCTSIAGYFNYSLWRFSNDQADDWPLKAILIIPVGIWAALQFWITWEIMK